MHYFIWIIGGFALLGLSGLIEGYGDLGAGPEDRLPFYFTALAILVGAGFCFFKGWRGAAAEFPWAKNKETSQSTEAVPATRKTDSDGTETETEFDVDAAFERYMKSRPSDVSATAKHQPAQRNGPAARSGFGRKGV
ncbi:hypothetical protein [Erythrobacter sp. F6033]|uniref:hypothetical protein n=1 Tax=Erythrobacter sp. F6033 TaxID=2926401 RepID=UPI001FF6990B|nr:hypothetical protein [Erythrobacter sp. F6033]MCK0128719.1 hypothetical protein [Erythrobacter sp. F6033]